MKTPTVFVALLHYPVLDKRGSVVTTAVTNLDIHDIARSSATYGVTQFYVVTPLERQQELVKKILRHWQEGYGATYNPARRQALGLVDVKNSLDEARRNAAGNAGRIVRTVVTSASEQIRTVSHRALKELINGSGDNEAYLILFGTGWGLAGNIVEEADYVLEPIWGVEKYNHLSVRSAAAITLDRLLMRENHSEVSVSGGNEDNECN
ncbi:MAG: RNA methyltransferase [Deltaproteobacteria bacterium]|nr:RNA methyltransferase [Deltaproteobacteria bacterium]